MAEKRTPAKRTKSTKPSTSAQHRPGSGGEDLHARIARRAYEISQSEEAASEHENWLRAEREIMEASTDRA
jgi:hypothetical protein